VKNATTARKRVIHQSVLGSVRRKVNIVDAIPAAPDCTIVVFDLSPRL
jgi:hypothetical protein